MEKQEHQLKMDTLINEFSVVENARKVIEKENCILKH